MYVSKLLRTYKFNELVESNRISNFSSDDFRLDIIKDSIDKFKETLPITSTLPGSENMIVAVVAYKEVESELHIDNEGFRNYNYIWDTINKFNNIYESQLQRMSSMED